MTTSTTRAFSTALCLALLASGCASEAGPATDGARTDGNPRDAGVDATPVPDLREDAPGATDAAPSCGRFGAGKLAGKITALDETSGLVASRTNPGVLWLHNDAGDPPELYAVTSTGDLLAVYRLAGTAAADWEDLAVGPGPDNDPHLYIGDIGDNPRIRPSVRVLRLREPLVDPSTPPSVIVEIAEFETITLTYPDGAHDAETLMIHPDRGELFVVSKSEDGLARFFLHRLPAGSVDGTSAELEPVETLRFGSGGIAGGGKEITAGDISPSGDRLLLRAERRAFAWSWPRGETLTQVLGRAPCEIALQPEVQGEAIGFAADGRSIFATGEGAGAPLFEYQQLTP